MKPGDRGPHHAERMRAFAELVGRHGFATCKALVAATGEKHTTIAAWLAAEERRGALAHVAHRCGWRMQGRYTLPGAPNAFQRLEKPPATTREVSR